MYAPIIQFGIAATQAAIIFVLFMRLKGPPSLKWIFAGGGFFWLLFLYGLSMTDYATRQRLAFLIRRDGTRRTVCVFRI